jgi:hypothetical protein
MKLKNGYTDSSGKGTITFKDEPLLRTHWGCGCCDSFDENEDSKGMKLTNFIVEILNKHSKDIEEYLKKEKKHDN